GRRRGGLPDRGRGAEAARDQGRAVRPPGDGPPGGRFRRRPRHPRGRRGGASIGTVAHHRAGPPLQGRDAGEGRRDRPARSARARVGCGRAAGAHPADPPRRGPPAGRGRGLPPPARGAAGDGGGGRGGEGEGAVRRSLRLPPGGGAPGPRRAADPLREGDGPPDRRGGGNAGAGGPARPAGAV
ncbi:MAG: 16S rRNA processing protein RimM, partial [uncultured Gemmatimonadetes bacterium]